MRVLFTTFLLPLLAAQEPPAPPTDLDALARRIDAAHHPRGPVPPVTGFRCQLELHVLDPRADQAGQANLDVKFLEAAKSEGQKAKPLIRYEVREAGTPIVRGRDADGPWHVFQGEARDLRHPDFVNDLRACERDTNLARQFLRFTDPAKVLRSLEKPGAVREEILAVDRDTKIPCLTVEGRLPAFPLLMQGGEDSPVQIKVFVAKAEGHLIALEALPLVDGKSDGRCERVHLLDLRQKDDLLVPFRLEHLFREAGGQLRPKTRAVIVDVSLRPELRPSDFAR